MEAMKAWRNTKPTRDPNLLPYAQRFGEDGVVLGTVDMARQFEIVWNNLPARGLLTRAEAVLLWLEARQAFGDILQVGCYLGRATCVLASLGRTVHAVDPFEYYGEKDKNGDRTFAQFGNNLACLGFWDGFDIVGNVVQIYRQRITEWITRPCGFAYLDRTATTQSIITQIRKAKECGVGVIAIHGIEDSGIGASLKRACIDTLGIWRTRVETLAVWGNRRRNALISLDRPKSKYYIRMKEYGH